MKHKEEEGRSQAAASLPATPTVERTGQGEVVLQESCASSKKTPQGGTGAMKPAKEKESAPQKKCRRKVARKAEARGKPRNIPNNF